MAAQEKWQEISARAIAKVDDSIPPEWRLDPSFLPTQEGVDVTNIPLKSGILTEREIVITNTYAVDIVRQIRSGFWTAVEVTRAFCKRASIAHQLTRCLTVTMFDEALQRAQELDDLFSSEGFRNRPLHGLPVSIKDNFNIIGKPSSVGFCAWAEEPMQEESTIVRMLREAGAIVFVKTNVPTAMMIAETVNNCYGRTLNPLNTGLTSGGSSGGEAALIAMKGSPLGVGTDIGGSLRIPASCTGIYTLKPSAGRFPQFDARTGLSGQEAVSSVHGPMARCLADLQLYASVICDGDPFLLDPKCIPLPWREVNFKTIKIGVMPSDGLVTPTPPVQRALREVAAKLESSSSKKFEIVNWEPEGHGPALELLLKFFTADGGKSVKKILDESGEPWRPEMTIYESSKELGVHEMWQLQKQRTALAKEYMARFKLDAILCPTTPYAGAPKHGQFKWVGYTGVFNIMDYSAVSFPTGVYADKEIDTAIADYQPTNEMDTANVDYDAEAAHGMPISLQLVCGRLEEEAVLDIAACVGWKLARQRGGVTQASNDREPEEGAVALD